MGGLPDKGGGICMSEYELGETPTRVPRGGEDEVVLFTAVLRGTLERRDGSGITGGYTADAVKRLRVCD